MKKIIGIIVVGFIVLLALTGCGNNPSDEEINRVENIINN